MTNTLAPLTKIQHKRTQEVCYVVETNWLGYAVLPFEQFTRRTNTLPFAEVSKDWEVLDILEPNTTITHKGTNEACCVIGADSKGYHVRSLTSGSPYPKHFSFTEVSKDWEVVGSC
jgi:hypothetical protein